MNRQTLRWFRLGIFVSVGVLAGCGQRELVKKQTYPTRGRVTCKGEPVRFVLLELTPQDPKAGAPAEGKTGEDGTFNLRTYSNEEPDGAVPGEYKVVILPWDPVAAGGLPKDAVPTKITDEMKAGVTVEIKAEDNDLEVTIP